MENLRSDVGELKIFPSTPSIPHPALEVFDEPSRDREGNSVTSASCPEHRGDLSIYEVVFMTDPGFSKQNVHTPHPSGFAKKLIKAECDCPKTSSASPPVLRGTGLPASRRAEEGSGRCEDETPHIDRDRLTS